MVKTNDVFDAIDEIAVDIKQLYELDEYCEEVSDHLQLAIDELDKYCEEVSDHLQLAIDELNEAKYLLEVLRGKGQHLIGGSQDGKSC